MTTPSATPSTSVRVHLGRTDIAVSPFNLGCNVFGWSVTSDADAFAILDAYVAAGGNFLDTANIYGGGESEQLIGRWIKARGLSGEIVVATKVGMQTRDGAVGLSREQIAQQIDISLARLNVDAIDLYYAHRDDPTVPLEETLGAFDELVRAGKVRALGASNYTADRLQAALDVSVAHGWSRFEVLQPHYNLVRRREFEADLQELCAAQEISVAPYYSLASGFLTGKYQPGGEQPSSVRAQGVLEQYGNDAGWRVVGALEQVAARHDASPAQVALAWLAAQRAVATPIASATSVSQLEDIARFVHLQLSDDDRAALSAASAEFA